MIRYAIEQIVKGTHLSAAQAQEVFEDVFKGKVTPSQLSAFLIGLKMKGESANEIFGAVLNVRAQSLKVQARNTFLGVVDAKIPIFDCCGTGGSNLNKFNVSTTAAFVIAASGIIVAKHGNRAMSSVSGSADVLESAGLNIEVTPARMEQALQTLGIGFLYAPIYHPALKIAAPVRKEIGVRTIFNIIGPLCNPAGATHQLIGVHSRELGPIIAKVLMLIGTVRSWVVFNQELKDEVSTKGKTSIWQVRGKTIKKFFFTTADFGLKAVDVESLIACTPQESALIMQAVLAGKKGAHRDIVLVNAACGLVILSKARTLKEGVKIAAELIDTGKAREKFNQLKEFLKG